MADIQSFERRYPNARQYALMTYGIDGPTLDAMGNHKLVKEEVDELVEAGKVTLAQVRQIAPEYDPRELDTSVIRDAKRDPFNTSQLIRAFDESAAPLQNVLSRYKPNPLERLTLGVEALQRLVTDVLTAVRLGGDPGQQQAHEKKR